MYRDLFLNFWSLSHASKLSRIVTALCRLVEGRPAPSLFPPRLDLLHICSPLSNFLVCCFPHILINDTFVVVRVATPR